MKTKILFTILVITICNWRVNAQWHQTNCPGALIPVYSIGINGDNIFVAKPTAMNLASGNDTVWSYINLFGYPFSYVSSFAFSGNNIFAGRVTVFTRQPAVWHRYISRPHLVTLGGWLACRFGTFSDHHGSSASARA